MKHMIQHVRFVCFFVVLTMSTQAFVYAQKPAFRSFNNSTKSLQQYKIPEWYKDAKLGYWVTWGLYSVPHYGGDHAAEWYGRWMYNVDDGSGKEKGSSFERRGLKIAKNHIQKYGSPKKFGYHDFIPMFKAEYFDADAWATLFKEGGAKYFVMMAMHHDNFCLWDTKSTPFNSVNMGPHRDFVAEMQLATEKAGMRFGVSNHSAWNGRFFEFYHRNGFDTDPKLRDLYGTGTVDSVAIHRWWQRTVELADKYKPDLYYFDWGWNLKPFTETWRRRFLTYYYNNAIASDKGKFPAPNVVVNYKGRQRLPVGCAVLDLERGGMTGSEEHLWQNDTSLGQFSWSYDPNDKCRDANSVIDMLIDIVSKNGVLLLNVGPKADGTIPQPVQKTIREVGAWLKFHGEGIYCTRPWKVYGYGPTVPKEHMNGDLVAYTKDDVRFTKAKDKKVVYIHTLGYPGATLTIPPMSSKEWGVNITDVELLGDVKQVLFHKVSNKALTIKLPKDIDVKQAAYTFAVRYK